MKKFLKIFGIIVVILLIALFTAPYLFKDKIEALVLKTINENVDAKVTFEKVDLSLFKNFPKATVSVDKISIINKAPFEGDTLFYSGELNLKMAVTQLFNGENEPMEIEGISSKNGKVNIIFNKDGIGNYDIALKNQPKDDENASESNPFNLKIDNYTVDNLRFTFTDEASKMNMILDSINHTGKGNFAQEVLDLDTKTTAKLSVVMDKMTYMKNVAISLEAVLGIDLKNSKYTFKENKALINQLPLEFNGFIQLLEEGQQYDLTFKTPTSSFKNFLGLLPEAYSGNLKDVKTEGNLTFSGKVNGMLTDTTIPKFAMKIAAQNAWFQYVSLPKKVQNITIDTDIVNETGVMNDTYININNFSFKIDQDVFAAKALIKNIAENALVNAELKGTINLANVTKAYPVQLDKPLTGILKADVTTNFDMKSVENSAYQNIKNAGTMHLTGFTYTGPEMAKPFAIQSALVQFNPNQIKLQEFKAKTGSSDINVTGGLDNFYGFLFKNQVLKGTFNLNSSNLVVADFMAPTTTTTDDGKKTTEAVKIPSFLDCSLTAKATTVVYDNLTLKNVSGNLLIKDEAVALNNLKMDIFGGNIGLTGTVSTKGKTPKFDMNLGLNAVNIAESFTQLDMLKKIAPIAGVINGKLNSTIKLSGDLTNEMTPNLKTLSGDLMGQLLSTAVNSKNSALLTTLDENLKFIDMSKLNLNDVKAKIAFENGKVTVKPFTIKYQDINVEVAGTHGFDQNMNYNLKFDVPAKYLGTEANALLSKLSASEASKIQNIPVNAVLTGSFGKPKVSTDLKSATTNLVNQLVKQQKDKLIGKGTTALEGLINKNKPAGDTTKTKVPTNKEEVKKQVEEKAKDKLKEGLNSLFNKKKKQE